jgi:hypothetical protein
VAGTRRALSDALVAESANDFSPKSAPNAITLDGLTANYSNPRRKTVSSSLMARNPTETLQGTRRQTLLTSERTSQRLEHDAVDSRTSCDLRGGDDERESRESNEVTEI